MRGPRVGLGSPRFCFYNSSPPKRENHCRRTVGSSHWQREMLPFNYPRIATTPYRFLPHEFPFTFLLKADFMRKSLFKKLFVKRNNTIFGLYAQNAYIHFIFLGFYQCRFFQPSEGSWRSVLPVHFFFSFFQRTPWSIEESNLSFLGVNEVF